MRVPMVRAGLEDTMNHPLRQLAVLLAWLACACPLAAPCAQTVRLPDYLCGGLESIFADSFESGGTFSSQPSLGSGGAWPGSQSRSFVSTAFGTQTYYLYVPPQYQPGQAIPLMVVLEGAAGSHAGALQRAQALRDNWIGPADTYGFLIAVPVSNGAQGGWLAPDGSGQINDYDMIADMLADLEQAYNIERNRVSVWGFSAGGHIAWDMLLNHDQYLRPTPLGAENLAAFATSAANSRFACYNSPSYCDARFSALTRQLPVSIHIGNSDPNYAWAEDDHQRLLAHGWQAGNNLNWNLFVGGHTFTPAHLEQVAAYACRFAVIP